MGDTWSEGTGEAGAGLPGDRATDGGEVLYHVAGGVARVTINRPERRNAMSWDVVAGLRDAVSRARSDPAVRVLVLTGAGDRAFCAGADLAGMASPGPAPGTTPPPGAAPGTAAPGASFLGLHEARGGLAALFQELWGLGKPTIARVRGYALAGGFGLALACDLVVAADDAVFGSPEIDVGLWPYMITVPLTRSMPPKKALELMLTGRRVGAEEAARIGFVTRVVPAGELDGEVDELAAALAAKAPGVMRIGRDSFYEVWDQAAAPALAHLHALLTVTSETEDAREGIAAFAEKRQPRWTGR
ncbi:MAG: enoyl-CoA hydratase/isomerase family protein [Acidimicrobiales bacterium]